MGLKTPKLSPRGQREGRWGSKTAILIPGVACAWGAERQMGLKTPKLSPRGPRKGRWGSKIRDLSPRARPRGLRDVCVWLRDVWGGGGNKKRSKEGNKKGGTRKKRTFPGEYPLCARDESRTHTSQLTLAPETSASTISPPAPGHFAEMDCKYTKNLDIQKINDKPSNISAGRRKNLPPSANFLPQFGQA